ncbi:hypothetical protein BGZ47_000389 [Haplosporangium gracile]|nr:hypothetical protein BGZ47_000386 [Haplosporangium gracile]KAF8930788.1 hypothetical protein BGZ47_000389 [Haplosporangium gracile]
MRPPLQARPPRVSTRAGSSSSALSRAPLVMSEQLPFRFGTASRYQKYPSPHPARPHPRPSLPHPRPPQSVPATSSTPRRSRPAPSPEQLPAIFRPVSDPQVEGSSTSLRRSARLTAGVAKAGAPAPPPSPSPKMLPSLASQSVPTPAPSEPRPTFSPSQAASSRQAKDQPGYVEPLEVYVDGSAGNEYVYLETIFAGAQGTAIRALASGRGWPEATMVCLKLVKEDKKISWEREKDMYHIAMRRDLENPSREIPGQKYLLKYFGAFFQEGQYALVLQLAKQNLTKYILEQGARIPRREMQGLIRDICRGLDYLHSQWMIVHRDIKSDNILLSASREILIADFGVAGRVNKRGELKGFMGTPPFMAPEITREKSCRYRMSVDCYSLGMLMHFMVCQKFPQRDAATNELINGIQAWELARDLVDDLLHQDPAQRLTIKQALAHQFFIDDDSNVNAAGEDLDLAKEPEVVAAPQEKGEKEKARVSTVGLDQKVVVLEAGDRGRAEELAVPKVKVEKEAEEKVEEKKAEDVVTKEGEGCAEKTAELF